MIFEAGDLASMLSYNKKRVQFSASIIQYCPEVRMHIERMFGYTVNYFWLERKLDSSIGSISDRLSEGTGSILVLVLWSFLISLSWSLRHIHVDTFALQCMDCPWTSELIASIGSLLIFIFNSLLLLIFEICFSIREVGSSESPSNWKCLFNRMQIIVMSPEETLLRVETRRGSSF